MFWTRFKSSIILTIITLATIILGGNILFSIIYVISLIGLYELYKVVGMQKSVPALAGYLANTAWMFLVYINKEVTSGMFVLICFLMLLMCTYVFSFPKYNSEQITMVFFGLIYVGIMLSFIYQTRVLEDGIWLVWLIFVGSWISDTFAYCTGMLIGKHKLSPKVSPKKSVEGSIGGIVGAALVGAIYAFAIRNKIEVISNPVLAFAVIGGASSIISQLGDLAASAIKRNKDIKDYGSLIPGHGGILDRFDSVIFTAPIVFYLSSYIFLK